MPSSTTARRALVLLCLLCALAPCFALAFQNKVSRIFSQASSLGVCFTLSQNNATLCSPGYLDLSSRQDMFLPNVTDGEQRLAVAMTVYSVCLLNTDHTVSCAGYDPAPVTGILGTESVQPITTVAQKIKLNSGQVPAGLYPTSTSVCVLYVSGSAACWGDGSNGALLSGNTETRGAFAGDMGDNLPLINVGTGRTIKKLFSGGGGFCAILDTDELICWGMNDAGQLGLESSSSPYGASASTIGDSLPRVNLGSHLHVTTLAMGNAHVCAMLNDSSVKCWGANYYGALGYNSSTNFGATNGSMGNNLPKWTSPVLANTTQITCGLDFTCTLNATGRVFCFGYNAFGNLGYGDYMNRGCGAFCPAPYNLASLGPVPLPSVALSISAGVFHTCALLDTFDVYCWGSNSYGQLGPSAIGASGSSPLLYAMGASTYAPSKSPGAPTPPTRRPSASPSASPHPPTGFANTYDAIAMGGHQTCVLAHYNSALQCFGKYDAVEELSDGLLSGKRASSAYLADEDFNCYVRLPDSKLICVGPLWLAGSPNFRIAPGYVSDFSGALVEHEISLPSGLKPQFVSSSEYNTCVMFTTGRVSCWGNGGSVMGSGNAEPHGVVDGDMGDALPFVDLGTGLTATRLSMGAYHACVLLSPTNVVKCWGGNWEGFLGTENSVDIGGSPNQMGNNLLAVNLGPAVHAVDLAVGPQHTCALLNTSRVVCWGTNIYGELGIDNSSSYLRVGMDVGTMGAHLQAVKVTEKIAQVAASNANAFRTCVITVSGALKCFGSGGLGALGYGDLHDRGCGLACPAPYDMASLPNVTLGAGEQAVFVAMDYLTTCVILASNTIKCMGTGTFGNMGSTNRADAVFTPLAVQIPGGSTYTPSHAPLPPTPPTRTPSAAPSVPALPPTGLYDVFQGVYAFGTRTCVYTSRVQGSLACMGSEHDYPGGKLSSALTGLVTNALGGTVYDAACFARTNGSVGCIGVSNGAVLAPDGLQLTAADFNTSRHISLPTGRTVTHITGGYYYFCVLLDDQTVGCWGQAPGTSPYSSYAVGEAAGELGDALPRIALGSGFATKQLMCSPDYVCCAVSSAGRLKCWGMGFNGQLGYGNTTSYGYDPNYRTLGDSLPFVDLGASFLVQSISVGGSCTCATSTTGQAKCWGSTDGSGVLGQDSVASFGDVAGSMGDSLPAIALPETVVEALTSQMSPFSCARSTAGNVYCWGSNNFGQLGLGDVFPRGCGPAPGSGPNCTGAYTMANLVPLNLQGHTARSLSLGSYHACVVSEVGTLWCWGQTSKGALGAALFQSVSQVLVPTAIVNQLGLVTYAPSRSPTRSPSFMPTKSPTLSLVTLSPQFIGVLVPPTGKVVVPIHALANYQVDHFSASVCPGNESYISVQLPASQTMAAGNSQSISVSVFNPGNFAMSPYGRAPVWHGGCVLMSADSATHSATQLIELNATFYLVCPPGAYNNDGDNVNQGCMHCVAGGYELAADTDRMQCAGLPCASGYWCGQSAVQGSTYRPILSASNITGNMVVKARKLVSWTIVNLDPSEDAFVALPLATLAANPWLKSITLPGGSFMDPQASNGSTNFASVPAQSASTTVQLDLDASLFVIPFGESVFNAPIALEWWLASNPAEVFIMTIPVVINVVTVLVTPKIFTYSLSAGQTYGKLVFPNSTDLSPPGEVQLLNSLCNNSITFTIRQGCAGNAVPQTPAWFRFLQPVGVTQTIEPQVGLGVLQDFGVDLTGAIHTQLLAQASDKAQSLLQCFTYDIELNGLNTSVLIPVTVSVTALVPCPPGYVSATGDNSAGCTVCSKSLYQNASGSTACLPCSSGVPTTLTTGATSAADCVSAINTFRLSDTDTSSKPCPSQANCSEEGVTLRSLRLRPGYWRTSANSSTILTCPFWDFCVGGRAPPLPSSDSRRRLGPMRALQNSSATASPTAALPENSLCAPHHHGVFCQNCDAGYVHRGPLRLCAVCDVASQAVDSQRIAGIMSGIALLVLFLFGFVYLRMRWTRMAQHNKLQGSQRSIRQGLENVMNVLDGVKLKIVIGLLQVVSGMSVQFVLVLPALFQQVAQVVNVFSLDLLKLFDFGCSLPAQNHYTSLVLTTNLPLLGCLFVLGVYVLARSMFRDDATSLQEARILCFTFFLVILFLVYPSVSQKILQTWQCQTLDDGTVWLQVDHTISCLTDTYKGWIAYAVVMFFVYVLGIPSLCLALLWRQRDRIDPTSSGPAGGNSVALQMRSMDPAIQHTRFLWGDYKPRYFWFEVWELIRKLIQTSILVFVAPGTSLQMTFQIFVTILSVVVLHVTSPYLAVSNLVLAIVAQWSIFAIALIAMMIKLDTAASVPTFDQNILNVLLVLIFLLTPVLAMLQISLSTLRKVAKVLPRCVRIARTEGEGKTVPSEREEFEEANGLEKRFEDMATKAKTDPLVWRNLYVEALERGGKVTALKREIEGLTSESRALILASNQKDAIISELTGQLGVSTNEMKPMSGARDRRPSVAREGVA